MPTDATTSQIEKARVNVALRSISICAGIGGLDLGLEIAVPESRTVCYLEREAFAVACLVAAMEQGRLAPAPVWSDLGTFDGRAWRGAVDCIIAGLPCQPYSVAGARKGHDDERAIWPDFIRVIEECAPALVFLENVAAFVQYFRPVGERLSALGYRIEVGIFSASEVGAPHRRERFFALAYRECSRWPQAGIGRYLDARSESETGSGELAFTGRIGRNGLQPDGFTECGDTPIIGEFRERLADAAGSRHERAREHDGGSPLPSARLGECDGRLVHAERSERRANDERRGRAGERSDGQGQTTSGVREPGSAFPPGPNDTDAWRRILAVRPDLAPAISFAEEVELGIPHPIARRSQVTKETPQSELRGVAYEFPARVDRLRACGNGVVAIQAAYAFATLAQRFGLK